ncbi:MAG: AAA family ATPase [Acidobacteria bacterium Pan2503]|uniref:Gluconokinase n=1 Tax=Candidatus Acidiferrum panamense TaxID=2741543 RepID=A0A7V8SY94_9BACT|nr:AAA family ATPase [Candidatus Acidoferrum panamensis]
MFVLLMGPAGSGKTTIGILLAKQLSWGFADADDLHSPANKEKMSRGLGLSDDDRIPWLQAIHNAMDQWLAERRSVVLGCSALKRSYREQLGVDANSRDIKLVYLKGSYRLLLERLRARKGHYQLLSSQLADLEEPTDSITIEVSRSLEQIVAEIREQLGL